MVRLYLAVGILFISLILVACGGGGPTATPSPTPTATPTPTVTPAATTAQIVFFSEREPRGLYLVNADGTDLTRIGDQAYGSRILVWSQDGTKVASVECPTEFGRDSEVYVMTSDGSGRTNVSNDPGADVVICFSDAPLYGLSWSSDGGQIVFYSARDPEGLYVVNTDGSGLSYLTQGFYPDWSPSGGAIVFARGIFVEGGSEWEVPIRAIDPDGSNERLFASVPRDCTAWALHGCITPQLRWSSDGSLLAFTAVLERPDLSLLGLGENPNNEVFVINEDGTGLTNVTNHPAGDYSPIWVNCQLPTAGCEASVANIQPERLNLRDGPGTDADITSRLNEGDSVCLLGSPTLEEGFQWWPVRTAEGSEGWAAAFDPGEPDRPWLQATGATC
jgi:Tol biopolymer transport system component